MQNQCKLDYSVHIREIILIGWTDKISSSQSLILYRVQLVPFFQKIYVMWKLIIHLVFRDLQVTEDSPVLMACQDLRYSLHSISLFVNNY